MKCIRCGKEEKGMVTFVNADTMEADRICLSCQAKEMTTSISEIRKIDEMIAQYEELNSSYEGLIKKMPKMEVPEGLESIAMTPLSIYKGIQATLSGLRVRKMELLAEKGSRERLEHELKEALEKEDYERSAQIKQLLDKMEKK